MKHEIEASEHGQISPLKCDDLLSELTLDGEKETNRIQEFKLQEEGTIWEPHF
jgi:hypothetical protein